MKRLDVLFCDFEKLGPARYGVDENSRNKRDSDTGIVTSDS